MRIKRVIILAMEIADAAFHFTKKINFMILNLHYQYVQKFACLAQWFLR
jgi:hypothetical protein